MYLVCSVCVVEAHDGLLRVCDGLDASQGLGQLPVHVVQAAHRVRSGDWVCQQDLRCSDDSKVTYFYPVFVDYYDDDYLRMLVLMTMMIVVMMIAAMVMMLKARTCCPSCFQRGIEPSKLPWRRACVVYYGYHGINMMMLVSYTTFK